MRTTIYSLAAALTVTPLLVAASFWGFVAAGGDPRVIHGIWGDPDLWILITITFLPTWAIAAWCTWQLRKP